MISAKNTDFLIEKFFSYGMSLFIVFLLLPIQVGFAYMILGYAHYAVTMIYQYKGGKISINSAILFIATSVLLFIIADQFPKAFTLFTSAFLLVHVFSGEIRHFNKQYSLPYFIMTLCLMALLCSWLSMELWNFHLDMFLICIVTISWCSIACVLFWKNRDFLGSVAFFPGLVLLFLLFLALESSDIRPSAFESFGFIVIAHYLTTYYNVTKKFSIKSSTKSKTFLKESLAVNAIFICGFIVTYSTFQGSGFLYSYFYNPLAFYVWTLMHFLSTWKNDEYKSVLKIKSS